MKTAGLSFAVAAALFGALNSRAARELSQEFVVADGLAVTLWVESPLFFKPTNIDVDQRGMIGVVSRAVGD